MALPLYSIQYKHVMFHRPIFLHPHESSILEAKIFQPNIVVDCDTQELSFIRSSLATKWMQKKIRLIGWITPNLIVFQRANVHEWFLPMRIVTWRLSQTHNGLWWPTNERTNERTTDNNLIFSFLHCYLLLQRENSLGPLSLVWFSHSYTTCTLVPLSRDDSRPWA